MPKKEAAIGGQPMAGGLSGAGNHTHPQYSTSVNGAAPSSDDLLDEIDALVEQSAVEPADVISAKKVQALVDQFADYAGGARQAALEALKPLIGCLPTDEREQLNLYPLFQPPDQLKQIDKFLASCPAPAGAPIFQPLTFAELLSRPPKQWLIAEVLGAGDIGMLYGPPGSGKSFLVIDLILAACRGTQWAMRFDMARPLSVAYCAGEGLGGLPQRFAAAAQHHGADDLPGFTFFESAPQLFTPERDAGGATAETIWRFVRDWQQRQEAGLADKLDMLIVDTLHSATAGADENSAQDMGQVLQAVRAASKALGCAVLLVHHSNKAGTGERGSSAMRGAMDFMIETKPVASKFAMECAKLKDSAAWKSQTFDLVELGESARVWWDEPSDGGAGMGQKAADKDALLAELRRYPSKRFAAKQLAEVIAKSENHTRNLLRELEKEGACKRELSDPNKPASSRNSWVYSLKVTHQDPDEK